MSANLAVPGALVKKAAQNLPQTATGTLYTVTGGNILVTGLVGVVTTVIGATATTLSLGTAGGAQVQSIATATAITGASVGNFYVPQASGTPKVASAAFVLAPPFIVNPFLVGSNITWTTSASNTGQMQWYLWYYPVDLDATVT